MELNLVKVCTACEQEKPLADFYKNGAGYLLPKCKKCHTTTNYDRHRGGKKVLGVCKVCNQEREVYTRNTTCLPCTNEQNLKQRKETQEKRRALLNKLKAEPCKDCGNSFPAYVMDFDHRPGTDKKEIVSVLAIQCASEKRIFDEIAKCDLVCSNCHRIRTFTRGEEVPA